MRQSLRIQLALSCAVGIAILLTVLGYSLYFSLSEAFTSHFEFSLRSRTALLISALDWDPHNVVHVRSDSAIRDRRSLLALPRYYEIWTMHGQPLLISPSLNHQSLPFFLPAASAGRFAQVRLPGQKSAQAFVIRAARGNGEGTEQREHQRGHHDPPSASAKNHASVQVPKARPDKIKSVAADPRHFIVSVARPTGELDASLDSLQWSLIIAFSAATLLSAFIIWWLLGCGLHPVGTIAEEITRVGIEDMTDRVSLRDVPIELAPIVHRLNQLLKRIEDAMRREKAMTADIAHELRTPLASMRASAELALSRPRDPVEYQRMIRDFLAVELNMQHMVENFLILSRLEAKPSAAKKEYQSDVAEMIQRYIADARVQLQEREIHLHSHLMTGPLVNAPEDLLRIVLRNVLENAISYVNFGGTIRIDMRQDLSYVHLEIANSGSRITKDQTQAVFERFWRGDPARSDLVEHSGLGLAIVHQAMDNLKGKVKVESELGGWFAIGLFLPISRSVPPSG